MPVQTDRIRRDIAAISAFTQTPGGGASRPTFSPMWAAARDYVIDCAKAAGCDTRIDAAGNVHARSHGCGWDRPAWLCGSHIDTVPRGGDYDGVAGIVVALELLRSAADDGAAALPLELIIFAEEEGTTFGVGMLGSRAWTGEMDGDQLGKLRNAQGKNYLEAGAAYGVDAFSLLRDRLRPAQYLGFIEVHIEQGPGLWRRDQRLAVVRAIAGRIQYRATVHGVANHAGAAAMNERHDALAGAAKIIVELESIALAEAGAAVMTVGRINNYPNAVNVIPDRVEFTIDLRAGDAVTIQSCDKALRGKIDEICRERQLRFELEARETIAPVPMNAALCARLGKALGEDLPMTVSGALHDAAVIAPHLPTVMLFVPSRDGISHNPAEFSRVEDLAAAAQAVQRVVRQVSFTQLNSGGGEPFMAVCGRFFEHSPWIAERAWKLRPFASLIDLHEKMCGVVKSAAADEQLALIRAHPDLVGRLAREGRLTRESNGEQAAAGLADLNAEEVAAFERYNAEYREKFAFPFVICARENRKQAILAAFPNRLRNETAAEIATALNEIFKIARLRAADAIWED